MKMKTSDAFFYFIPYDDSSKGKTRPVLVYKKEDGNYVLLRITSKYKNKSEPIKKHYYEIKNLSSAGLSKASWIDIKGTVTIQESSIEAERKGSLSDTDKMGLIDFITTYHNQTNVQK